ncbi:MAG: 3-keto-5-aminohexanoate cleavage protein [Burkholderiales bacterium]
MNEKSPVMIMVAPNGARALKKDNPATPISPKEIAEEVIRCAKAGASIAHLHARQEDGQPTQSIDVFREIADRIREHSDIVLQISLGTIGFTVEEAIEPVDLNPEMVSLPLDGFLKDDAAAHEGIRQMALKVREHHVRPELSVYNERMLEGALRLIEEGAIDRPACFGLIMRDPESIEQGAQKMIALANALPANSQWWMARGGRYGLGLRALAVEMGGHVRVGFEDSVRDFDQVNLAKSNAYLVERMASLCNALGRSIATPAEARRAVSAAP